MEQILSEIAQLEIAGNGASWRILGFPCDDHV